ncbi:MAG: glycosyltransferase [Phycisphaerales bacterium]|nr:glycosyltransferase [Phycisphaerales bacterium]
MRIVLVNWAHIWDGANKGGGVNGYCQALALELTGRGHDVVYLSSGTTFTAAEGGVGPCAVHRHPDWLGIRVFEVINSPVLAPAFEQFRGPEAEAVSPELEGRVGEWFRLIRPDLVHFHNIEGLSAGCIEEARRAGASVVYSLHNYHTVCPQAYLMRGHRRPCFDSQGGRACAGCIETPDPVQRRLERAGVVDGGESAEPENGRARPARPVLHQLMVELKGLVGGRASEPAEPPPITTTPTGRPVVDEASVMAPFAAEGLDDRGQTQHLKAEGVPYVPRGPWHPDWEPLENEPAPEPAGPAELNAYGRRRRRMVEALNRCDRVLAVSEFVRAKFEALGVSGAVLRTQHIGTKAGRVVAQVPDLVFDPPEFDEAHPRPVRLVFMGFNNYYKGLEMLADSLELLTPEYLARLHLFVYAQEGQTLEWRFRRLEPKLGGLTMHHGYRYYDIPWMLGGKDLGVVPSVWWDNAPQTVFEYLACGVPVLGARLGGIPDFITHGRNGLLFRGNDRYDLARTLVEVARRPGMLFDLRRNVRPPKDIGEHAAELEAVYNECLCAPARSGA